jgi:hypothetical protein
MVARLPPRLESGRIWGVDGAMRVLRPVRGLLGRGDGYGSSSANRCSMSCAPWSTRTTSMPPTRGT